MARFVDLLVNDLTMAPGQQQVYADEQFPILVADGRFHYWKPGDPIASKARRILIGIAPYIIADLRLLDALHDMICAGLLPGVHVDVFNINDAPTNEDLNKYVPGIGRVFDAPIVGIWDNGNLVAKASAYPGRKLLTEYYPDLEKVLLVGVSNNLQVWKPGCPVLQEGKRILIGASVWSIPDLLLLDALKDIAAGHSDKEEIEVFNYQDCRSREDFERYVPGIGAVLEAPVVGIWQNGVLMEKGWGKMGLKLLTKYHPILKRIPFV